MKFNLLRFTALITCLQVFVIECLHLSVEQDAQLQYLINLQNNYATNIKQINSRQNSISAGSGDIDSQIKKLQSSILKERQQIFKLRYNLIPSSSEPFIKCQVIPQNEKSLYKKQVQAIKSEIKDLEDTLKLIPECDEIKGIQTEIQKLQKYIERIENVIENNCEQIIEQAQHTFQSNLLSENWVLGEGKTMDDVINEYYERAQKQSNVTNCPIKTPYFNGQACIMCSGDAPVFDLSRKICMACFEQQTLNKTTRKCEYLPKNSNYESGKNYVLAPLKYLPQPNKNLSTCEAQTPYFNGTHCISCPLPSKYWNVSESKCRQCSIGLLFDENNHKCVKKLSDKLTYLPGTRWVTNDGNVTRVLQERMITLQKNKTTGQYTNCPEIEPYFDGLTCIYCSEQFNLDTLKCSSAPKNLQYDKNLRKYIVPEVNKETDPEAQNYITQRSQIVDSPDIQNCNETHPYFDQVSCIYCQKPFVIFNYDENSCVACSPTQIYNDTAHKCEQRLPVFVQGRETNLLATDQVTIDDYKNNLYKAISENPDKMPLECKNKSEFAAVEQCIGCDTEAGEYFNVQTYKCSLCDGIVNETTHLCQQRKYYLTNLDQENILIDNLEAQKDKQEKTLTETQRKQVCPVQTPNSKKNQTGCYACPKQTPLYNYSSQNCSKCPQKKVFDGQRKQCRPIVYLTNLTKNILVEDPDTIQKYINLQDEFKKNNVTEVCPEDQPYTFDHKLCMQCYEGFPLFNISSGLCTKCDGTQKYIESTFKCQKINYLTNLSASGLLEHKNYTVQNVKLLQNEIIANGLIYENCSETLPYGTESGCVMCIDDYTYFNLSSNVCNECPEGTRYWPKSKVCKQIVYVTNITAAQKLIQSKNFTIQGLNEQILKLKSQGPVQECPEQKPYKNSKECIECPESTPYFFLQTLGCKICENFKPQNNTCPPKPPKYPNLLNYKWVTYNQSPDTIVSLALKLKEVPDATQCFSFYNVKTKDCVNCSDGEYFNADTFKCQACSDGQKFDINIHQCTYQENGQFFTNLEGSNKDHLIYGGLTYNQLQARIEQTKTQYPDSSYCDDSAPYFDGFKCVNCPSYKPYFNLRYQLCQVCLQKETFNPNTHNCEDESGAAVWRKPSGELVYPFLFGDSF